MKRHLHTVRDFLLPLIDFFYPPFRRLMDLQTFRYAACGGGNTLLGLILYAVSFRYILREHTLHLGFYAFKAHVAALFMSSCVVFPTGFFLMKYVVFSNSFLRGRVQLVRYFASYLFSLMLNYLLLKIFVEIWHVYAIAAQILTTAIVILFSYLIQKNFTFRAKSASASETEAY
ncbi:MAG TPA: GtrA family protein [Chitinophagaceae bacterium]|nr:GtrA family protein [Chitinophagaceae bacterium]